MPSSIEREVEFGESHEERILKRWMKSPSKFRKGAHRFTHSEPFCDFDFYVYDKAGFVVCYVEVKRRRSPLSRFGDVMVPLRKHKTARREALQRKIPQICVTEYGCGALVEVTLAKQPSQTRDISRRDRPGRRPVPHAIYSKRQITVLDAGSDG